MSWSRLSALQSEWTKPQVMTASEAADLAAELHAGVAIPIHYAFTGGWFTDTFVLGYDGPHTPDAFVAMAKQRAPAVQVRTLAPGQTLEIAAVP